MWNAKDAHPTVKNTFTLLYYFCEHMAYIAIIMILSTDMTDMSS